MDLTPRQFGLGELIERLRAEPNQARRVPVGFRDPHSYRGYYEQLAFEIAEDVTVGEMLAAAESALGSTYQGWKGGDYTMCPYTETWLVAREGECGESLGALLLELLLRNDEAAYRAGREDAARDIAEAIERANDAGAWAGVEQPGPAILAYDHAAGLARMYRVPDCGDEYHGADGGPCSRCGFDVADLGDQPRTVEEAVGDNPEEQRP